jgi:hypothetical protein
MNVEATIQTRQPLTPALSPFDGEREVSQSLLCGSSTDVAFSTDGDGSLSPSDGERARVRGRDECKE